MSTRYRQRRTSEEERLDDASLDLSFEAEDSLAEISDEDIQAFLEEQEEEKEPGFWNLPTAAGLSIITVGVAYVLQEMGLWAGFDLSVLANALPWLAGILIILLGFGVLNWKPKKKARAAAKKSKASARAKKSERDFVVEEIKVKSGTGRKRLMRSERNKKVSGVAGGIGEYFGIDPTLIRIAFVIAVIFGFGAAIPIYILLTFILPKPGAPASKREERITIIREHP